MNRVDALIDRGADRLRELAERATSNGHSRGWLARELADDAEFLRKLKPSLIAARARGQAPTSQPPAPTVAPSGPQLGTRPKPRPKKGGPSPVLVVGAAFAAGVLLAKLVDWRGHAHPRA